MKAKRDALSHERGTGCSAMGACGAKMRLPAANALLARGRNFPILISVYRRTIIG
jgi:hypothetical protein